MSKRRQHDEPTVMPTNGQRTSHPHRSGWVREMGVGQMKVWLTLIGINPAGSITPFKEGLPRTFKHGLDPRKRGNRREILPSLNTLPIPRTETRSLRRLLLRDACLDPHGRNISPKTCAKGTGHRLFRWHGRYRLENENLATRGFTSFSEGATPSLISPILMPTEYRNPSARQNWTLDGLLAATFLLPSSPAIVGSPQAQVVLKTILHP